jgi:hypothetical protein
MDVTLTKGVYTQMSFEEDLFRENSSVAYVPSLKNVFFGQETDNPHSKIFPGNMYTTAGRYPPREQCPSDLSSACVSPRARFEQDLKELHSACTLIDKLGTGSFGSVYKCKTKGTDQVTAVKVYTPKSKSSSPQTLRQARRRLRS